MVKGKHCTRCIKTDNCCWRGKTTDRIAFAKKFIQDSLVKEKVIQNDGWKEIDSWTDAFAVDAQRPRVEVELEEV